MKYLGVITFTTNSETAKIIEDEEKRVNDMGLFFNKSHFIRKTLLEYEKNHKK